MKITVRAGGVIRSGPERDLCDDYLKRAGGLAKACGFLSITEQQIDLRRAKTRADETRLLLGNLPQTTKTVILDERGKQLTSRQMSRFIDDLRRAGQPELCIVIGGADGFEPSEIPPGTVKWALGPQTWPHKFVRVMITEQVYRALSILAGTPYHRD